MVMVIAPCPSLHELSPGCFSDSHRSLRRGALSLTTFDHYWTIQIQDKTFEGVLEVFDSSKNEAVWQVQDRRGKGHDLGCDTKAERNRRGVQNLIKTGWCVSMFCVGQTYLVELVQTHNPRLQMTSTPQLSKFSWRCWLLRLHIPCFSHGQTLASIEAVVSNRSYLLICTGLCRFCRCWSSDRVSSRTRSMQSRLQRSRKTDGRTEPEPWTTVRVVLELFLQILANRVAESLGRSWRPPTTQMEAWYLAHWLRIPQLNHLHTPTSWSEALSCFFFLRCQWRRESCTSERWTHWTSSSWTCGRKLKVRFTHQQYTYSADSLQSCSKKKIAFVWSRTCICISH